MKRLAIFLLAFGLGSLTVVGQDAYPDQKLFDDVDALAKRLRERAARIPADPARQVVQRIYDIGDLMAIVADRRLEENNLFAAKYGRLESDDWEPFWRAGGPDFLIELIRNTVEPESWDVIEGCDIQPRTNCLVISTIPRVHEGVEARLAQIRAYLDAYVAVEITAVEVDPEAAAILLQRPRDLAEADLRRLRDGRTLGRAEVVCTDGQEVAHRGGTRRRYLADYEVEIAQGASIGDPRTAEVFDGVSAQVRAILDRNRGGCVLHLKLERTELGDPMRTMQTQHGSLDLPDMALTRVNTSLWVPLDRTVIVGGGTEGSETCLFLVRARRIGAGG